MKKRANLVRLTSNNIEDFRQEDGSYFILRRNQHRR